MIELSNAGVRFGERWIYRNLDFVAKVGRSIAILGPNGHGKTTLVRSLLGFLSLNEGSRIAPGIVGYVPQAISSPVSYKVKNMVAMGRVAQRGMFAIPSTDDQKIAEHALNQVGMPQLANQRFDTLSGGERQLVLLARAIATGASTLVLDEPASALDLRNQDRFLSVVEKLRIDGKHSIIFTTHLPQHACAVADDVLMMFDSNDRIFGEAELTLNEGNLSRLYSLPVRIVSVASGDSAQKIRGVVPLFGLLRGT